MSCNGNVYNIGMGCCEPVLGPVENYYTKPTIDRKLEEITSAITSGCCITPEEVDEKIEEAISGITVSGVTEEQLNEAIASVKTEIEAEIPTVPTSNTAFTNDAGYLTEHQSLSGYATTDFVSAFTYDKATIDEKVAGGGSFDPSQYYNKTATDALLDEKLDVTAYTPTDLSNYYTKQEVDSEIISAITDVEAEIPTVPTSNTAFTNDAGYLTEHQSLTAYSTTQEVNTMINQSVSGKQDTLIAGENITISGNVISATSGGGGTDAPISAGTGSNSVKENYVNNVASGAYSHAEGRGTSASGNSSHAEGNGTSAKGNYAHAEGHSTVASGDSSHAEGELTNANGMYSHAEGTSTKANNVAAHAEGRSTTASGKYAHAEGILTVASGQSAHAEGNSTRANGSNSHAEGDNTIANNESEHASGKYNVSNTGESISAQTLFSVGNGGWDETAQDVVRHNAFEIRQNGDIYITKDGLDVKLQDQLGGGGGKTIEAGRGISITTGETADTVSFNLPISASTGSLSIAENNDTVASGMWSHAEGAGTRATSYASHAEGKFTEANGDGSHAEGVGTITNNFGEHASGKYNVSNTGSTNADNTLFSVGNGGAADARHNAFEIRQNGDIYFFDGTNDVKLQDVISNILNRLTTIENNS